MKKTSSYLGGILLLFLLFISVTFIVYNRLNDKKTEDPKYKIKIGDNSYDVKLLKEVNKKEEKNYLISPYSIKIALNMLASGAEGKTKEEIINLVGNDYDTISEVKNRINVANAVFIKDKYEKAINEKFVKGIKDNFQGELLFDKFESPKVINKWVKEKTYEMIPSLLDDIPSNFVLGLANAVAVDVDWQQRFDCAETYEEKFKKIDDTTMKVSMMSNKYKSGVKYIENKGFKGVIVPYVSYDKDGKEEYEKSSNLEFVGILPDKSVDSFIEGLDEDFFEKFDNKEAEANKSLNIRVKLPIFSYSYTLEGFDKVLQNLGIKKAFSKEEAEFTNIITEKKRKEYDINNIYVDQAVHKTFIDLNEKGTKAAAVTYFGLNEATAYEQKKEPKIVEVKFDKPFLYMIRDKKTKEVLFLGVVYEPSEWKGVTCEE